MTIYWKRARENEKKPKKTDVLNICRAARFAELNKRLLGLGTLRGHAVDDAVAARIHVTQGVAGEEQAHEQQHTNNQHNVHNHREVGFCGGRRTRR